MSHDVQLPEAMEVKHKLTNKHGCGARDPIAKDRAFTNQEANIAVTGETLQA